MLKKKKNLLKIAPKKNTKTHLGIRLTKEVKDFYTENYKILIKEIKGNSKNGKIAHVLGLEE